MPRFGRKIRRPAPAGFSLVELLVAMGMLGVALSAVAAFGSTSLRLMRQNQLRLEVRHALRASGDSVVRDLRLAAACLPQNGRFVALDGIDSGTADSLTIRTGYAQDNLACVATATNAVHASGSNTISADVVDGFGRARMGYIRHLDGDGEFFSIADVDPIASTITRTNPATRDFPVGSGVFAVDERVYSLDASGSGPSRLMLEVDRTGPGPFAVGISGMSVRYVLDRNCPPCDVVDLPIDDAEWRLVNQVAVTLTAETVNAVRPEDYYSETRTVVGKPRNLLP
jgi:prepilin-type N-terminal cleavage/methylation domain-containing protein